MSISQLHIRQSSSSGVAIQGTDAQDVARPAPSSRRRWVLGASALGAAALLIIAVVWLARLWSHSRYVVSAERLRVVPVQNGPFVRDVAAEGTVVAAVSPTLYAVAAGTITYSVHAGESVTKGQALGTLDSPELTSEYQRERATLDGLNSALAHQEIEIRRQLLASQQQADLAQVAIRAAERELARSQSAWDLRVIPERDYQRAADDVATAKLNFEHARDTANLERDSVVLDMRTRRLERDRQALVVGALKRKVDDLTVRSPVSGMVANLAQQEKARVADGAALISVVDLSAFEIEFQVAESYAGDVKPGMNAEITLGGTTVPGTVTAISPEVRQSEVTGRVRFAAGQPPALRQNERASLRIVMYQKDTALKFERGAQIDDATRAVYVVRGAYAVRVPVQLGPASVGEIEVQRGLTAGDQVIVSDTRDFNDAPELRISR
jgi:HlyD family secretion protein